MQFWEIDKSIKHNVQLHITKGEICQTKLLSSKGSPTPSVNWLKEVSDKDVLWIKVDTPGYKVASSGRQHSLILMEVEKKHGGMYTCIATNRAGQSVNTARLDVETGQELMVQLLTVVVSESRDF